MRHRFGKLADQQVQNPVTDVKDAPGTPETHARMGFDFRNQDDGTLDLMVYGEIVSTSTAAMYEEYGINPDSFVSTSAVKKALASPAPYSRIRVRINSPGGSAFEGMAIYNYLRAQGKPIETCVDGVAASAASIVAMCGDTRTMGHNAMMMLHNAYAVCMGTAIEMRKMADTLDKVSASIGETYRARTGKSNEEIRSMMDAETWLSAEECLKDGFCTAITGGDDDQEQKALAMAREFRALSRMKKVPDHLRSASAVSNSNSSSDGNANGCECYCGPCQEGNCFDCNMQGCSDENCKGCPMQQQSQNAKEENSGKDAAKDSSDLSLYKAKLSMLGKPAA